MVQTAAFATCFPMTVRRDGISFENRFCLFVLRAIRRIFFADFSQDLCFPFDARAEFP